MSSSVTLETRGLFFRSFSSKDLWEYTSLKVDPNIKGNQPQGGEGSGDRLLLLLLLSMLLLLVLLLLLLLLFFFRYVDHLPQGLEEDLENP